MASLQPEPRYLHPCTTQQKQRPMHVEHDPTVRVGRCMGVHVWGVDEGRVGGLWTRGSQVLGCGAGL
jgi:hypothetical protein